MCGISGIIGLNGSFIQENEIVIMNDEIKHRGPDGEGFLFTSSKDFARHIQETRPESLIVNLKHSQPISLGHRRLSILDLDKAASQPMTEYTGRYWIVFNGEIYNHVELRLELEKKGFHFKTDHSDTEVILNAYACWGRGCLEKFNGMWAFCLWDQETNEVFMARDRAGKKPLYYTVYENQLYFASELKAILRLKKIPKTLREKSVYDFLTYTMVPAPNTIFKDIYKIPAAHYLFFKPGEELITTRYWSALNAAPYFDLDEADILEGVRERLYASAKLRMVADVGVGVLLSGGVDSSVNLACLSKYSNQPIKAFTVGFENKDGYTNEFEYARKVAKHFNADYNELTLTEQDFFDFFPKMVYYQDEPIADPANIPIYYISKVAANQNVKVLLGGEGSDELFIGYQHWKMARDFSNVFRDKKIFLHLSSVLHSLPYLRNKRVIYHDWYTKSKRNKPVFWGGTELRSEGQKRNMLDKGFLSTVGEHDSFESIESYYRQFKDMGSKDEYDWMSALDLQYRLPDLLLARLDRMMMAASVEGRNPFLDVNFIEYVMRIKPELRTKNKIEKYVLKKAFEGILPHEILYRKKDSFTVPLNQLFNKGKRKSESIDAIEKFNTSTGILSRQYIEQMKSKPDSSVSFWNLTNLALWYNQYKN